MKRALAALITALLVTTAFAFDLGGRVITVGSDTTYPPFETVNEAGEIVGFDVDVVKAICEQINCVVEFQTTAWDGIFAALAAGEFDMVASGASITEDRLKVVDFTDPYFVVSQAIALRVEDEDVTYDEFIAGLYYRLGAQTGTTNAMTGEELVGRERLSLYDTFAQAFLALVSGDIDGVIVDDAAADSYIEQHAGELVIAIRGIESGDMLGFAIQKGDELADALNYGLEIIKENGTLDALTEQWLSDPIED